MSLSLKSVLLVLVCGCLCGSFGIAKILASTSIFKGKTIFMMQTEKKSLGLPYCINYKPLLYHHERPFQNLTFFYDILSGTLFKVLGCQTV